MNLDNLKKSFFGYQKESVCQYISCMEEEFRDRLLEKDGDIKKMEEKYQLKIQQLEKELQETKNQLDAKVKEQMMIGETLMEARRYAESLKEEARSQQEKMRQQLEKQMEESKKELVCYRKEISNMRKVFADMVCAMDKQAEELDAQMRQMEETSVLNNQEMPNPDLQDENDVSSENIGGSVNSFSHFCLQSLE